MVGVLHEGMEGYTAQIDRMVATTGCSAEDVVMTTTKMVESAVIMSLAQQDGNLQGQGNLD
jgi:hypothetical protein